MFRCAHEPEYDSLRFPDGVEAGDPWIPTAECRLCGERFDLKRE
jgi:hypothetical protein